MATNGKPRSRVADTIAVFAIVIAAVALVIVLALAVESNHAVPDGMIQVQWIGMLFHDALAPNE